MKASTSKPRAIPADNSRKLLIAAEASESELCAVDVAAKMASRYIAELHVIFSRSIW